MAARTKSLDRMWNDWRATFPASNRAEDGWIGDKAHQAETSGHNPDDTPGSRAEYSDADTIAEVRAIDKDARLNSPIGMQQVVDRMLATPADRNRLRYIIFNGHIWRKNGSWKRETYTGSDKHRTHAHFSGDPNFDDAAGEWTSITSFKRGVAAEGVPDVDAAQSKRLTNTDQALYALAMLDRTQDYVDEVPGATRELPLVDLLTGVRDEVHAMHEVIGSVFNPTEGAPSPDLAAMSAAFLAVLQSPAGKAAIVAAVNEAEDS